MATQQLSVRVQAGQTEIEAFFRVIEGNTQGEFVVGSMAENSGFEVDEIYFSYRDVPSDPAGQLVQGALHPPLSRVARPSERRGPCQHRPTWDCQIRDRYLAGRYRLSRSCLRRVAVRNAEDGASGESARGAISSS